MIFASREFPRVPCGRFIGSRKETLLFRTGFKRLAGMYWLTRYPFANTDR
jgi:hypothetical protein